MIRILIVLLMQFLGFEDNPKKQPVRLHKKQRGIIMDNGEIKVLLMMVLILSLFFILVFLFSLGTESGLWYNHPHI